MIYLQHTAQGNMSAMRTLRGSASTPKGLEIRWLKEAVESSNGIQQHIQKQYKPYSIPDRKLENAMTAKVNRRFHLKVNGKFSAMLCYGLNYALLKRPLGVKTIVIRYRWYMMN